jgi:hypothetical protein
MPKVTRATFVLTTLACATMSYAQSLSSTTVPAQPPLVLELPSRGRGAVEVMQRLLTSAAVPFGLEQSPDPIGMASTDVSLEPQRSLTVNGLSIRAALDRITAIDPRYEWEETDGRIIVRGATLQGSGVLSRRIAGLTLTRATLQDSVQALARAIDPSRTDVRVLTMGVGMSVVRDDGAQRSAVGPPSISVSLGETTVFDALNAVARAAGLSWVIRYDGPADLEGTSIALSIPSSGVVAMSSRAVRVSQDPAARARIRVWPVPTIMSAYGIYAGRAKVLVGVELPTEPANRPPNSGGQSLDLTYVTPAEAIDQITRLDPRLSWSDAGGIFTIRPRADLMAKSPLDDVVERFDAQSENVDAILARIAQLFGGRGSGSGGGSGTLPGSGERAIEDAKRARPMSFTLGPTTLRQILDTLCRTQGTLSWTVHPMEQQSGIQLTVQLTSWDGWSISRSVQLPRW